MPTINALSGGGSSTKIYDLGTAQSFNVAWHKDYATFTRANFLIEASGSCSSGGRDNANGPGAIYGGGSSSLNFSYNSSNGTASIYLHNSSNGRAEKGGSWSDSSNASVHAYLVTYKKLDEKK